MLVENNFSWTTSTIRHWVWPASRCHVPSTRKVRNSKELTLTAEHDLELSMQIVPREGPVPTVQWAPLAVYRARSSGESLAERMHASPE